MICLILLNVTLIQQVDIKDVIALRDAIVASGKDIHRPMNLLNKMKCINRDREVNQSLMTLLAVEGGQSDKEVGRAS